MESGGVDRPSVFLRYGSLEIPRLPLYMYDVEHVVPFRTIWDMVGGGPLGVRPTNRFDGLPLGFPQQAGL